MAEEQFMRVHLETAVAVLEEGQTLFDDLVRTDKGFLMEDLYALNEKALRAIVFGRVVAARGGRSAPA